ncbi:hypothetical protein FV140_20875 [Paenarthrobacter ureafaciens]|nr:hypothetical protein FV140_20875 [Paenarthrobacter ureafaciens]
MAGFIAGRYFQAPDLTTIKQSAAPISVWSPVEERVVDDRQSFAAVVKAGTTISVPARSAIEPAVIVRQGLDVGALAQGGSLAGVVSGQPYFLLPEPLPLFRNLYPGDSGDDVLALQRSMNAAGYPVIENATVDGLLMSQIAALFQSDGFELPTSGEGDSEAHAPGALPAEEKRKNAFIPYLQLLPIPRTGGTVVSSLPVGAALNGDSPLMNLRISENYVEFIADVTHATALSVGQELTLRIGTKDAKGRISAIEGFKDGKDGQKSGRPVTVVPTDATVGPLLTENLTLTVLSDGGASRELAVPLSAVRQDASGIYVEKRAKQPTTVRTPVSILKSGGGYAAVAGDIGLGDEVLIS